MARTCVKHITNARTVIKQSIRKYIKRHLLAMSNVVKHVKTFSEKITFVICNQLLRKKQAEVETRKNSNHISTVFTRLCCWKNNKINVETVESPGVQHINTTLTFAWCKKRVNCA